jgi:hypothetical protein
MHRILWQKIPGMAGGGESSATGAVEKRIGGVPSVIRSISRVLNGNEDAWSQTLVFQENIITG